MSILSSATRRRSPAQAIAGWWHDWMRAPSDLDACSDEAVGRMAHDIGISASELRRLARHSEHDADLLRRRMAALNLDPAEVAEAERATFLDLERVCTLCARKGRCRRDLTAHPDDADWEDYCPNVATLKMLDALPWASRREW
ncbi:MAG TPA: DUF6455 family protein [Pseudolabrys sp.]|jgi:hypothetical protein|nr:DUF6455 family protein [Pseudolabrys sp.]